MKSLIIKLLIKLRLYYKINDRSFYKQPQNKLQYEFYRQIINKGDLVFDVGGNVGQRSKIFLDLGAKVIAFEPQPICIEHLKSRFHNHPNFTLENCALGEKDEVLSLHLSNHHTISSLSEKHIDKFAKRVFQDAVFNKSVLVPVKKLEDMINKYGTPKFLKIDVEGFEKHVFMGLDTSVPFISFEFTPMEGLIDDTIECINRLEKINSNYKFNLTLGEGLNFVQEKWLNMGDFLGQVDFNKVTTFGDIYAKIEA